ncbi:hypothetical protein D3C81_2322580 [compost metagenome]
MSHGATETVRLHALQLLIRQTCDINESTHSQQGIQEEARKVNHPLIRITL